MNISLSKKLFFSLALAINTLLFGVEMPLPQFCPATNKTIEIAYDFHGVIASMNISRAAKQAWAVLRNANNKAELAYYLVPIVYWGCQPKLADWNIARTLGMKSWVRENSSPGEIIGALCKAYPCLNPHYDEAMAIANSHTPIQGTVTALQCLKSAGYNITLASNLDTESAQMMAQKHPALFALFIDKLLPWRTTQDVYIAKPNTDYFVRLAQQRKADNPELETIVFVDDSESNVKAALKTNELLREMNLGVAFQVIHFKNPEQAAIDMQAILTHLQKRTVTEETHV
ncbi:MAG: HAD family hydrolase [Candidatus Babeliales bacterium]